MHLHFCTEHIQEVEGEADIFSVSMEVYYEFVAAVFTGKVETWDVFNFIVIAFRALHFLDRKLTRFRSPLKTRFSLCFILTFFLSVFLAKDRHIWSFSAVLFRL